MTTKDVERYSVLLAKQQWLPQGYSAVADSGAKPGQFQLVEDFLRLGVRLTDRQGRTGLLVLTVRSPPGTRSTAGTPTGAGPNPCAAARPGTPG